MPDLSSLRPYGVAVLALAPGALAAHFLHPWLGLETGTMLFLLGVVFVSYFFSYRASVLYAFTAFLLINFLLVEPRYTLAVYSLESLSVLFSFLLVSLVISSLVARLREQTAEALLAKGRAEHARLLADALANVADSTSLYKVACNSMARACAADVLLYGVQEDAVLAHSMAEPSLRVDPRAVRWCSEAAQPLGTGTPNWPELPWLLLPLERTRRGTPVVVCLYMQGREADAGLIDFARGLVDQLNLAYQRIQAVQRERLQHAQTVEEATRSALLASIAHDMRTPLTRLLGSASLLQQQLQDQLAVPQQQLLDAMLGEARHMTRVSDGVLCLARLEHLQGVEQSFDWQSTAEIIEGAVARFPGETRLRLPPHMPEVLLRGDAGLLIQALVNLLDNALRYAGSEVELDVLVEPARLVFAVQDRGPGVPPAIIEALGQKFLSGRSADSVGFGLGLAIAAAVAQVHGGTLELAQRPGGGTRALLAVPLPERVE